ncbi:hypothetical protein A0H81_02746 [Grifola frondosa]|uniref:BTB domain-containing protein n=1 Tax=Grifola frondosa TaxID=5627 RepID=A0A1C7MLT3_GRIFR|nr:hypothetical protein A0H81_02746 [Grifola frondosa]
MQLPELSGKSILSVAHFELLGALRVPFFEVQSTVINLDGGIPFFAERLVFRKSTPTTQSFPVEIELEESDVVLETILRFTYPLPEPVLLDLDDVCDAYQAATKYQLLKAMQALRRTFLAPRFVDSEPVRVYAIAKRFDMEEVAEIAAKQAMKFPPIWPDCEEFKDMSAQDYHALISMHRARGRAASACLDDPQLKEILRECSSCANSRRFWWKRYVEKARPMLMEAPTSDIICRAGFVAEMVDAVPCRYCCEMTNTLA